MDAANRQRVNNEEMHDDVSANAGPIEDIHARIAEAFTASADYPEGGAAPGAIAAPPISEILSSFVKASEAQSETVWQLQQDRQELRLLKEDMRDLCNATISFSSHAEQRFCDIVEKISTSDNRLAALTIDHSAYSDRLEAADKTLKDSESKFATLAMGQASHANRLEAADKALKDSGSKLEILAAGHAAHADRLEGTDRNLSNAVGKLGILATGHAAHADRLEAADRNLKDAVSKLGSLAAGHTAHAEHLEAADRNLRDTDGKLGILATGHAAHARDLASIHKRFADSDAVLQQLGKHLEASHERLNGIDSSILVLLEQNKDVAMRQNAFQASIRRLEELLSSLEKRLVVVSGLAEPVEFLRAQNIDMENHQRELRKTVELVVERVRAARETEVKFEQRIGATEQKVAVSGERMESISRWQSRIGMALSAGPRD